MFAGHDPVIARLAAEHRLADPRALALAAEESGRSGRPLATVLLESGRVSIPALLAAVAGHIGGVALPDPPVSLPGEALAAVDGRLARRYRVAPLQVAADGVALLAEDPLEPQLVSDLTFALGRAVRIVVADPARVRTLIGRHYGGGEESAAPATDILGTRPHHERDREPDIEELAGQAPVVQFVNLVLSRAIRDRASDVHFEPFEDEFRVRLRRDGALEEIPPPPRVLADPVISRLKVLANLNIAERRVPQDGRIRLEIAGRSVDLRVSTLPTRFGESVVLRVLDQAAVRLELAQLGLPETVHAAVREVIRRPHGIFIVTGPTGSGKTTTLYSCLQVLNATESKLLTVEDPIEYEIDGVMQVPVHPAAGLTFAAALRSFLRQDPDIVMVGEIRDLETAQIAIQAALTGHLVLTTLHTNDAPGAITRLVDMGVEPFLLAATVEAVLAQRLVRRICPTCRQMAPAHPAERNELGLSQAEQADGPFHRGAGCPECHGSGYRGRLGIFEMLVLTDALRDRIAAGMTLEQLRAEALGGGMVPLRDSALRLARAGETTLDEVVRHT